MMTFVKLENGILKRCPRYGVSGGLMHTDLPRYYANHPDIACADGWLLLVTSDKPDGVCTPSYTVDGDKVVQSWTPVEQETVPQEPTLEDKVDDLSARMEVTEGALLELADEVYKEN